VLKCGKDALAGSPIRACGASRPGPGVAWAKRLSVGVLAGATKPLMRQAAGRKVPSGALRASRALDERVK